MDLQYTGRIQHGRLTLCTDVKAENLLIHLQHYSFNIEKKINQTGFPLSGAACTAKPAHIWEDLSIAIKVQ